MNESNYANRLEEDGYAIVPNVLEATDLAIVEQALADELSTGARIHDGEVFAHRNVLQDSPTISAVANSPSLMRWVEPLIGSLARPVRSILFNKTSVANWLVPWHQDLTIAVDQRLEIEGYGPWSVKSGVVHVKPPVDVLKNMVTIRLSLDDCNIDNGPLRVIPGSHAHGVLRRREVAEMSSQKGVVDCCVPRGGAVLMKPLILHSSKPKLSLLPRRVLHIEYAGCELADGLKWAVQ